MPLWLIRLAAAMGAAMILMHVASALVTSGAVQALADKVNPDDPARELARSLLSARRHGQAKVVVVGNARFTDVVRESCRFAGEVVTVPITRAGWRDYRVAAYQTAPLRPALVVFQARPYLWTNIRLTRMTPSQKTELLPRRRTSEIVPMYDLRVFISALKEVAKAKTVTKADAGQVPSLLGLVYDSKQSDRYLPSLSRGLLPDTSAVFVLDPEEFPEDVVPETRLKILEVFDRPSHSTKLKFSRIDRFADQYGCDRDAFRSVARAMRDGAPLPADAGDEDDDTDNEED
jgi:hypothetical protein